MADTYRQLIDKQEWRIIDGEMDEDEQMAWWCDERMRIIT
jgi:hypothetical protein